MMCVGGHYLSCDKISYCLLIVFWDFSVVIFDFHWGESLSWLRTFKTFFISFLVFSLSFLIGYCPSTLFMDNMCCLWVVLNPLPNERDANHLFSLSFGYCFLDPCHLQQVLLVMGFGTLILYLLYLFVDWTIFLCTHHAQQVLFMMGAG